MSYIFKNALVRNPSNCITGAISSRGIKPIYQKVCDEHNEYIKSLVASGINVNALPSLKNFPDSIFIEDTALAYNENCILLRAGTESRFGESEALAIDVKKYFKEILVTENGKVEGGDILRINNHFIIGLSERTNKEGQ